MSRFQTRDYVYWILFFLLGLFAVEKVPISLQFGPEVKFAQSYDTWTDPESPADKSLNAWLYDEALLVCNILDTMRNDTTIVDPVDPKDFCKDQGTDPTRPPPEPDCDWGSCDSGP